MTAEPPPTSESPAFESADEPEWRIRLRAAVERTVRQRAARAEQRQALSARRTAGLQARLATRLTRMYDEPP